MITDCSILSDIAIQAGERIEKRSHQLTEQDVSTKSTEKDIVTVADKEAESFIRSQLKKHFPDIDFYGEEGDYGRLDRLERVFIVDPIDGTTNYLHGYPFYCVSIGLRENGVTTAGVVYLPALHTLYTAVRGQGAWKYTAVHEQETWKNGVRLHVSRVSRFIDAVGACGFACVRSNLPVTTIPLASDMIPRLQGFRRSGSAAIDLCHIAEGSLDFYWEFLLKPWDYEAGRLIAQEAGARVTGFDGNVIDDDKGQILASNGLLHDAMLQKIQAFLSVQR